MHRDKRNKTLKAQRENKRRQETAGLKLLGSGRNPRTKQRSRQNSFQPEGNISRGLAKVTKRTNSRLREGPSLIKCCTTQGEKLRTAGRSGGRGKGEATGPKVGEESERQ